MKQFHEINQINYHLTLFKQQFHFLTGSKYLCSKAYLGKIL